jgi:serine/threonine protein kinase
VTPTFPLVGQELGGYRLQGVLARGEISVVYEAESPRLGATVALKVLALELSADDTFRTRFLRESRIAASLNHANVLHVHELTARHRVDPERRPSARDTERRTAHEYLLLVERSPSFN